MTNAEARQKLTSFIYNFFIVSAALIALPMLWALIAHPEVVEPYRQLASNIILAFSLANLIYCAKTEHSETPMLVGCVILGPIATATIIASEFKVRQLNKQLSN